ncbi:MAG: NAD-dependent epimerase/dehydratase family protein [Myxococcota bacterium]|jgi:UDP-glucose 4-epimerase
MKKQTPAKTVAVLGISGYVGQHLMRYLEHDGGWNVVGIDINAPMFSPPGLKYYQLDVRQDYLTEIFTREQVDVVVHLAFLLKHPDNRLMREINVDGTGNVMKAATEAGVQKVILTTSTAVYGANRDNPPALTEEMPLRGHPNFPYVRNQLAVEELAAGFAAQHQTPSITVLRPCVIYGRRTSSFLLDFLRSAPVLPLLNGENPKLQFIHVEDLVRAIVLSMEKDVSGAFNIVSRDTIFYSQVADYMGKKTVYVPSKAAYIVAETAHLLGYAENLPPYVLDFIWRRWVADGSKAERELEFKAKYTSIEALASMLKK